MGCTYIINNAEYAALLGLSHEARSLYHFLRRRMDFKTGTVGHYPNNFNQLAIYEELEVVPSRGSTQKSDFKKNKDYIRARAAELERAGSVERVRDRYGKAIPLVFKLLLADYDNSPSKLGAHHERTEQRTYERTPSAQQPRGFAEDEQPHERTTSLPNNAPPPISDITTTTSSAREDQFRMFSEWVPGQGFASWLIRVKIGDDLLTELVLIEFVIFWMDKNQVKSQKRWEVLLLQHLERLKKNKPRSKPKLRVVNKTGFVERHTDRSWADDLVGVDDEFDNN